jgi:two-component system KDP operon response regulator KdpE
LLLKGKGPTILIVDDEAETRRLLGMNLKARGYEVLSAADGTEGLKVFGEHPVNLVLLDVSMPGPDGVEVCRHLCSTSGVPVIMLSARARERDKVSALDAGAVDYVTKPFGVEELMARVRSALRRVEQTGAPQESNVAAGPLTIDAAGRRVILNGRDIPLTKIEFALLSLLARNAGRVLTHKGILDAVWGGAYGDQKEYLWAYISRLRAKLEADPENPTLLLTVPGVGYRLAVPAEA